MNPETLIVNMATVSSLWTVAPSRHLNSHVGKSRDIIRWNAGTERFSRLLNQAPAKMYQATPSQLLWLSFLAKPFTYSSSLSDIDPQQLSNLWEKTLNVTRDPTKIMKALHHSYAFVVVISQEDESKTPSDSSRRIIGVGRAISDGAFIATICDVAVDPTYQRRGIGRKIVKKLIQDIRKKGGPTGFAVFPPPIKRQFFWMLGFRFDQKYRFMAYYQKTEGNPTTLLNNQVTSLSGLEK